MRNMWVSIVKYVVLDPCCSIQNTFDREYVVVCLWVLLRPLVPLIAVSCDGLHEATSVEQSLYCGAACISDWPDCTRFYNRITFLPMATRLCWSHPNGPINYTQHVHATPGYATMVAVAWRFYTDIVFFTGYGLRSECSGRSLEQSVSFPRHFFPFERHPSLPTNTSYNKYGSRYPTHCIFFSVFSGDP